MSQPGIAPPQGAEEIVLQSEFARRLGVTKSYVTALKHRGRLALTEDGRVRYIASMERLRATSAAPERAAATIQGPSYASSQERERHYSAELKRIELERQTGKLLQADEVASAVADAGAAIRSAVEAWRDRMPPQIAALGGDERRIAALVAAECDDLLRGMSERFGRLAAVGGADA